MEKKISLSKFIFIQVLLMIVILLLYLIYIFPYVKPMCKKSGPCASTSNCSCENKMCVCDYLDENGKNVQIECELQD